MRGLPSTESLRPLRVALQSPDEAALLKAHHDAFGPGADAAWFDWKYRRGGGVGVGLWAERPEAEPEMAAFCGGVPRRLMERGRLRSGLQIGDVLVRPAWRGAARRTGAFFRVSQALYESQLGLGCAQEWGFGFPSQRHLRLAVTLGLLHDAGPMIGAVWKAGPARALGADWHWRECPVPDGAAHEQDLRQLLRQAAAALHRSATAWVVAERTVEGLWWRLMQRPGVSHRFWAVFRPWRESPVGVVVMRSTDAAALWLDWLGPPGLLGVGLQAARQAAMAMGHEEVHAWMSAGPWRLLANSGALAVGEVARIGVPVASSLGGQAARQLPWWFMGADTDFL